MGTLLLVGLSNGAFKISDSITLGLGGGVFIFGTVSFLSLRSELFAVFAAFCMFVYSIWMPAITNISKLIFSWGRRGNRVASKIRTSFVLHDGRRGELHSGQCPKEQVTVRLPDHFCKLSRFLKDATSIKGQWPGIMYRQFPTSNGGLVSCALRWMPLPQCLASAMSRDFEPGLNLTA